MAGHIRDRWMTPDPENPKKKIRTSRYGKGSRWVAVWVEPTGDRKSRACATKDEAQAVLDQHNHAIRSHNYIPVSKGEVPFQEFFEEYLRKHQHTTPQTRRLIRSRINNSVLPDLGNVPIRSISRDMVQELVNSWNNKYAPNTIRLTVGYLSQIFNAAVESKVIAASPMRKIKVVRAGPRLDRFMTLEELHQMADALPDRFARACRFNAGVGLRPSELGGLIWPHVKDLDDGYAEIYIDKQIDRAGRERVPLKTVYSERWLLIGPKVRSELGERGSGFVFTNRMGNPFDIEGLAKVWATARTRAGLEHVTGWHETRHFHASLLIAGGMSPVAVAKRLGHKDATETLRTYSHLWPDDHAKMASIAETLFAASTERPS